MNRFVLKNTSIKILHIPLFDKYFYKNKESKLGFEDRVVVDFLYKYGGSTNEQQIVKNTEEREALEILGLIVNFVYLELVFFYLTTLDLGWHGITFMYLAARSHVFHYWSLSCRTWKNYDP